MNEFLGETQGSYFAILSEMVKHPIHENVNSTFEKFVLLVAIAEPLSTLPQIYDVYASKDATSLSFLSWALFSCASFIWLIYGIKIKSSPLIASSILWISTELTLMAGILLYS